MMTRNMLQVVFSLVMFALAPTLAQTAPATPCDPKVEQANLTVFQSYLKDLTTLMGQFDRTLYWSTDATLDIPAALPYGGKYTFAEFPKYESALMQTWQLSMGKPPTLYASCDKVFLQGSWDATATATGKKVSQPILEVFTFEDGKIINDTFFFFDVQEIVKVLEP
jgi:ketosteroid isomerase-like protein